jgi:hypothetical protein
MRRRRYLQTTALALTGGLTGCSELGISSDSSTPTETPEPTEMTTPTETAEATPRDDPRDVDTPLYMDLLPRPHLKGTDGAYSDNATFTKVDWKWYLQMRETVPKFGPTSDEYWSFKPVQGNRERAPSADILKTPVYGALVAVRAAEDVVFGSFPDLGPELERQCGLQAEAGEREDARVVDEVLNYYKPSVTYFIGADTDAVRDALEGNKQREYDGDVTAYQGTDDASARGILVSDKQSRGVVAVETADEQNEALAPMVTRLLGRNDSVVEEESVQWCLGELVDAPVVTGEINGGRPQFGESPHGDRGIEPVEPFDALLFGMDVSEYAGTVQAIVSDVDGEAPEAEALREAFEEDTGEYSTRYHPNVSTITGSW